MSAISGVDAVLPRGTGFSLILGIDATRRFI
jgi:hypothetical protein